MRGPANLRVSLIMQDQLVMGHYRGTEYIELHLGMRTSGTAFAVINVWDYRLNLPTIDPTRAAVSATMKAYRRELFPHQIEEYMEYARRS